MILDLNANESGNAVDADLCIVGGGMGGITVARALRDSPISICLLESGGLVRNPALDALGAAANDGPVALDLAATRPRVLGGGSAEWGNFCLPLDEIDLTPRPELPLTRWPIDAATLAPYYRRAHQALELGPEFFDERLWPIFGATPPAFDTTRLRTRFWQLRSPSLFPLVSPLRFGSAYRAELARATNLTVVLNATATRIDLSPARGHAEGIEIRSLAGRAARVRARTVLLACGAIENARLLMHSGVTDTGGFLGRCFMEHPHVVLGTVETDRPRPLLETWAIRRRRHGVVLQPSLCPAPQVQAERDILNASVAIEIDRHPDCPTLAFASIAHALATGHWPRDLATNLGRMAADPLTFAANAYRRVVQRAGVLPRVKAIVLYCRSEQEPNRDSRIILDREVDALGMPRVRLDWRLSDRDRRTVEVLGQLVAAEFARLGIGRVVPAPWRREPAGWPAELRGGPHHAGTTRMSADPKDGVVDPNGLVHGTDNLYATGTSLLPTSGYANPAMTVIALALRTADHLRTRLLQRAA